MQAQRTLIVVADDFGIGPETSRGIIESAQAGAVAAAVLLINSPYAAEAVTSWRRAGLPFELGWHPCLTLDAPILPAAKVPSLVDPCGRFWTLGPFMARALSGRIRADDVRRELAAQFDRFCDLVGNPPTFVNSHQHVAVFNPVGGALRQVLAARGVRPYVRRVCESAATLRSVPGGKFKRLLLTTLGRREAARQRAAGLPGSDYLLGITNPECIREPDFFAEWLARARGRTLELMVHPGHRDETLIGRDCRRADAQLTRRCVELRLLLDRSFANACRRAGFRAASPSEWRTTVAQESRLAA